ncbi:hypothetical protein OG455_14380 [Kitasatospora sp. NBC_01287]|uniref:hypothetical protein n=1 Tax=Kitasatospora sp. NBC_01287 TaxID=2903573 RepID=UPI0022576626|nr:hypothetical protein [Kitasatospora sp. NBC_01287]MCX4746691.1 hypothetical protein [Kitasatospora sp. NBC_01287]
MAFNAAQYQSTVDKLNSGLGDLSAKLDSVPGKANDAANHWWVPDWLADKVIWFGRRLCEIGSWILNKIKECLEGAAAPVYLAIHGFQWESLRGLANGVTGELQPAILGTTDDWKGPAADAYGKEIPRQAAAATALGGICDRTSTSLELCAVAGLTFYLAIALVLVKFIAATITAIAALGSVVFSWAGFLLILEEAGVNTAIIVAAVSALVVLLGAQAKEMAALHGNAVDTSQFPGGHWPVSAEPA